MSSVLGASETQVRDLEERAVSQMSLASTNFTCSMDMNQQEEKENNCCRQVCLSGGGVGNCKQGKRKDEAKNSETLYELVSEFDGCGRCESRNDCCCKSSSRLRFGLLYSSREPLKLKDFGSEIRASMDVEQFVHQAELVLDLTEVSVESIVDKMLQKVVSNDKCSASILDEARDAIFIPGSTMLVARTIQGVSSLLESNTCSPNTGHLNYDQSWLCALCNLAQISRRHMVLARFKQPTNMGENAHEVRLFALILTPSKEKGTKNALETGRTFATMFTDAVFRRQLLEARNETQFKALMLVKAHELSEAKALRNRHKYKLDPAIQLSVSSSQNLNQDYECFSLTSISGKPISPISGPLATKLNQVVKRTTSEDGANIKSDKSFYNNDTQQQQQQTPASLFSKNPETGKLFELISQSSKPDNEMYPSKQIDEKTIVDVQTGSCCACFGSLCSHIEFGKGLLSDLRRRLKYYPSDFRDAFIGPPKTVQKTVATIWFLYFGILLPTIAFSSLNTTQTHGYMGDLRKAIIGQAIGGLGFALLGGQPLVIIMTTAPLCLYTKVIHQMCIDYGYQFPAMYAAIGLWNGFFLTIYSLFGFSKLMKWCTRSTEEIFALFIVIAFITDAGKDLVKNFRKYYYMPACQALNQTIVSGENITTSLPLDIGNSTLIDLPICRRETSLLFLLLMLGTLWLATTLYKFNKTPFLEAGKRELLADYALPTAVIAMSFLGSYVFDDIFVEKFPPLVDIQFERAPIESLPISGIFTAMGLGFTLSLLFFMDQNISAAMVNAPQNRLKKGCAYHLDLLVVAILNGFLTLYGLPMMHGVLPHSPLHARSLADIEERVEEGHLREVIANVRETRVTGIVSHILVLGTLLLIPYPIAYIPTAVLNGLFLYMAVTSLDGLQIFERILLLFTEQTKYPPNHYIRRCPQGNIHRFTVLQLFQLLIMCLFGFSPYNIVEMFFPVIILLMIPFRHKIVPKYIDKKYLEALDGKH